MSHFFEDSIIKYVFFNIKRLHSFVSVLEKNSPVSRAGEKRGDGSEDQLTGVSFGFVWCHLGHEGGQRLECIYFFILPMKQCILLLFYYAA